MVVLPDVIVNMKRTIEGKEKLLATYRESLKKYEDDYCYRSDGWFQCRVGIDFLEMNLDELRTILKDLEEIQ